MKLYQSSSLSLAASLLTCSSLAFTPPLTSLPASTTDPELLHSEFLHTRDATLATLHSQLQGPKTAPLEPSLAHFTNEYFHSLQQAAQAGAVNPDGTLLTAAQAARQMMHTLSLGMKYGMGENKFVFRQVRHEALRGNPQDPRYEDATMAKLLGEDVRTDFYQVGCDFFRSSMDLKHSVLLGEEYLKQAREQLQRGENVVFLANHQSEADPQVVSCLFETMGEEYGELAAQITFVAGHKVTTDALAIPFSMGRNLLCIHSKKHIDADPLTKPAKSKQNMAAMNEMLQGLKDGGMAIWVAPSGGRDRRNVSSGKIPIAPFDAKTVDMFRLMGNKSKTPTHFYPMAMVSYDLCPPPDFVEAGVGETRNVRFTPVGIAVMEEVPNVGGAEKRHLFTHAAEFSCIRGYEELLVKLGLERYM